MRTTLPALAVSWSGVFDTNYALSSTGGFTLKEQRYAIAHQISLIDLSGSKLAWLGDPIQAAAANLHTAPIRHRLAALPEHIDAEYIVDIAGTAAPFVLAHAGEPPTHDDLIKHIGSGSASNWLLSPSNGPSAYELTFNRPARIKEWITENEEQRMNHARQIKGQMLSTITIYGQFDSRERVYLLQYAPSKLRQAYFG